MYFFNHLPFFSNDPSSWKKAKNPKNESLTSLCQKFIISHIKIKYNLKFGWYSEDEKKVWQKIYGRRKHWDEDIGHKMLKPITLPKCAIFQIPSLYLRLTMANPKCLQCQRWPAPCMFVVLVLNMKVNTILQGMETGSNETIIYYPGERKIVLKRKWKPVCSRMCPRWN